jgi:hypothetical protein
MTVTSTFPTRLREATRPHHEAVERSVDLLESCQSLDEAHEQAITELAGQIFTKFERWFRSTAR